MTWGDVFGGILGGLAAGASIVAGMAVVAARFKAAGARRRSARR